MFSWFEDEDLANVYATIHLRKKSFWARLKYGIKYIFGYQCRYGAFDEFIFNPNDARKLNKVVRWLKSGETDAHPHWVSVEDELPKIGKDVLVLREDGEMQVAHQYNEEITRWWSVDGFPLKNNITHWMPLPQPPKSGSSEIPNNCEKGGEE